MHIANLYQSQGKEGQIQAMHVANLYQSQEKWVEGPKSL